ncbi:hypothetical protein [Corallococcus exercitus]|uniref:effector-associated domain 2-containing protein n=1 Tax=Corallococcus exercitus TaxID=2316736 RepID=UPI0035D40049
MVRKQDRFSGLERGLEAGEPRRRQLDAHGRPLLQALQRELPAHGVHQLPGPGQPPLGIPHAQGRQHHRARLPLGQAHARHHHQEARSHVAKVVRRLHHHPHGLGALRRRVRRVGDEQQQDLLQAATADPGDHRVLGELQRHLHAVQPPRRAQQPQRVAHGHRHVHLEDVREVHGLQPLTAGGGFRVPRQTLHIQRCAHSRLPSPKPRSADHNGHP